jgi:hypothetical protein
MEPSDEAFVDAVDRRVAKARRWSRARLWIAGGLALVGVTAITPSLGAIVERVALAASRHTDWTELAMSLAAMPALQAGVMALAAAGGAFALSRVPD